MAKREHTTLEVAGLELKLSSPGREYFPAHGGRPAVTKLDLAEYYIRVADATVNHLRERPTVLKRWRDGITGEFFFQKRVPEKRPDWLQTATVSFPSGRTATELVPNDAAHLVWAVNLGNIDWNPWPVRRDDLDHPDELRIDLDPQPGIEWSQVRQVALTVHELLQEMTLVGYPKTSGSRGGTRLSLCVCGESCPHVPGRALPGQPPGVFGCRPGRELPPRHPPNSSRLVQALRETAAR